MTSGDGTGDPGRPTVVSAGLVTLVLAAVMLLAGGLLTAAVSFDTLRLVAPESVSDDAVRESLRVYRGVGLLLAAAGAGLLVLTVRAARRDPRYRRAVVALALALVVLVSLATVLVGTHLVALLSLFPLIIGTVLLTRPAARIWFAGGPDFDSLEPSNG